MTRRLAFLATAVVAAVALAACSAPEPAPAPSTSAPAAEPSTAPAPAEQATDLIGPTDEPPTPVQLNGTMDTPEGPDGVWTYTDGLEIAAWSGQPADGYTATGTAMGLMHEQVTVDV